MDLRNEIEKVLLLYKEDEISLNDALELIYALKGSEPKKTNRNNFKHLKILIDDRGKDKVNLKIPLEFIKLLKLGRFANVDLSKYGIDVDDLIKSINEGLAGELINVETDDGEKVL